MTKATEENKAAIEETTPETPEESKKYEIMLILIPDLAKESINKELKAVRKFITDNNGEIFHEDDWGVRDLAYIINKQDQGYYVIFYFTFDSSAIVEFEKTLRLNQNVIRHMQLGVV